MKGRSVGPRVGAAAAAAILLLLLSPVTAHAKLGGGLIDDAVDEVADTVEQTTGTVVSTTDETLDEVGGAVSDAVTSAARMISDATVAGRSNGSSGSSGSATTADPQASGPSADRSSATGSGKRRASGPAGSSHTAVGATARSPQVVASAGATGMLGSPRGPSSSLLFRAPPPPRASGRGGSLATTGIDAILPLGILLLLTVAGLTSTAAPALRDRRIRFGAWRYVGRHRMPPRRRPVLVPAG